MLKIDNLEFAYGDLKVLWGISLEVNKGEIVTLPELPKEKSAGKWRFGVGS